MKHSTALVALIGVSNAIVIPNVNRDGKDKDLGINDHTNFLKPPIKINPSLNDILSNQKRNTNGVADATSGTGEFNDFDDIEDDGKPLAGSGSTEKRARLIPSLRRPSRPPVMLAVERPAVGEVAKRGKGSSSKTDNTPSNTNDNANNNNSNNNNENQNGGDSLAGSLVEGVGSGVASGLVGAGLEQVLGGGAVRKREPKLKFGGGSKGGSSQDSSDSSGSEGSSRDSLAGEIGKSVAGGAANTLTGIGIQQVIEAASGGEENPPAENPPVAKREPKLNIGGFFKGGSKSSSSSDPGSSNPATDITKGAAGAVGKVGAQIALENVLNGGGSGEPAPQEQQPPADAQAQTQTQAAPNQKREANVREDIIKQIEDAARIGATGVGRTTLKAVNDKAAESGITVEKREPEPFIAALAAAMRAAQMSRVAQTAKNVGSVTKTGLKEGIEQSAGGDNGGGNTKRSVDAAEAEDAVDKRGLASFLSKVFRIGGKAGKELAQEGASRAAENAASGNGDQNQSQKRSFEPVARSPNSNKALGRKIGKAVVESQRSGASEAMARPGMLSYATVGLAVAVAVGAFNVAL